MAGKDPATARHCAEQGGYQSDINRQSVTVSCQIAHCRCAEHAQLQPPVWIRVSKLTLQPVMYKSVF